METLVVFTQHQNQYHSRIQSIHGSNRHSIGSISSGFREINCRNFQSGSKSRYVSVNEQIQNPNPNLTKTSSVSIPLSIKHVDYTVNEKIRFSVSLNECNHNYSELWAGPAYSNSPPPSSLPIPKFSIKPKRSVSLDLPSVSTARDVDLLTLLTSSAPTSPTSECETCFDLELGNECDDSATKTLCRLLNLDVVETD